MSECYLHERLDPDCAMCRRDRLAAEEEDYYEGQRKERQLERLREARERSSKTTQEMGGTR